ncbi:MAG: cytochrome c [Rhodospirillaceae bacterium]|nr:cytochrome c [Rhodospirillaceae bacterium]
MRLIGILLFLAIAAVFAAGIPALFPSLVWQMPKSGPDAATADPGRGAYLFAMSGCMGCHTRKGGTPLAGGREIPSPFGVFVSPNITPDAATGVGGWTEADFIRAMTLGLSPDERHYYPAFPYVSYTRMTLDDLRDLWAYLKTVPPATARNGEHRLAFPYSVRPALGLWKLLFLEPGRYRPDPGKSRRWNRGAYIVTGPAHCGECHTRRNVLGGLRNSVQLAGAPDYGDGSAKIGGAPNITPHEEKGIGSWSADEIVFALQTGVTPSGDVMGGEMEEVVTNVTSKLTDADRRAIAEYLRGVPAKALE